MQIQGSGRIKLTDGTTVRVHYDGKNGYPYSSIGRYLVDKAIAPADRMSMAALMAWLRADLERGRQVMWQNLSYVFFREIKDNVGSPLGAMQVPLTPERSLAIDTAYHALGTPIYVSSPTMKHVPKAAPFNRLMVGQDVGSAIRGSERGDIYFGSGDAAAKIAGSTKHPVRFFVLVPNAPPGSGGSDRWRSGATEGAEMNCDGGGKPRRQSVRAGRQLTEEEVELWHQLGRSLDKVRKKPRVTAHSDIAAPENPVPVGRQSGVGRRASQEASPRPTPDPRHPTPDARLAGGRPAAPAEIDRRTHRQVAAGKVPIDAVLDLHGLNQEVAHSRLRGFLMGCRAKGHRMVLVITGKGAKAARSDDWPTDGSRGGVLRRNVPLWLDDPELRAIVVSYAAAGVRHGGEGALYIRLRKAREG